MSRQHAGHYRRKHPTDKAVDPDVAEAVASQTAHGKITCKAAFAIAARLSVPPSVVGTAIDLQEGRITACQLGLFGYGKTDQKLKAAAEVDETLETAISASLMDGRLPCEKAWQIADSAKMERIEISRACEALGVKVCKCQIGAF